MTDDGDEADAKSATDAAHLPPVLVVAELANYMRVDRKTVYELIRSGVLPGVRRCGRSLRIHRDTVVRWLADGQGRAPRSRSNS